MQVFIITFIIIFISRDNDSLLNNKSLKLAYFDINNYQYNINYLSVARVN